MKSFLKGLLFGLVALTVVNVSSAQETPAPAPAKQHAKKAPATKEQVDAVLAKLTPEQQALLKAALHHEPGVKPGEVKAVLDKLSAEDREVLRSVIGRRPPQKKQ